MGEMADDLIDRMWEQHWAREDQEWYSYPPDRRRRSSYPKRVVCRFCNDHGVYWLLVKGKYKLYNRADQTLHACGFSRPTNADGFEEVETERPLREGLRSLRTGELICPCNRGYASEMDGLCRRCRRSSPPDRIPTLEELGI